MSGYPRRSAVWSDPRVKPPYGAVEIDRGHPLSIGLKSCFVLNEAAGSPRDSVTGLSALTTSPFGSEFTSGSDGVYFHTDSAGLNRWFDAMDDASIFDITSQAFSVVVGLYPSSSDGSGTQILNRGAFFVDGWYWEVASSLHLRLTTNQSGASQNTTTTTAMTADRINHIVGTRSGSSVKIYLDGREASYSAVGVHVDPATTAKHYRIGANQSGGAGLTNGVSHVYFYRDRVLSASDVVWLYEEPFVVLRPITRRRYFVIPPPPFLGGYLYDDAFDYVPLFAGR